MGIENIYKKDGDVSAKSLFIEAYNKAVNETYNGDNNPKFHIEETEDEHGKIGYIIVKDPYFKYYLINDKKRWKTYTECHEYYLNEYFNNEDNRDEYLREFSVGTRKTTFSSWISSLSIDKKLDMAAERRANKEWISDVETDYVIKTIRILSETEKEQIKNIEGQIGFGGWLDPKSM